MAPKAAKKTRFVISVIGDDSTAERAKQRKHANTVLNTFIKPALKELFDKDEVVRADAISEPGDINRQILDLLANADLVVADLTFHNPNVFYELAIRHMLGKPYVQLIHKDERIPFDIGSKRTIKFDITDTEALDETRKEIGKHAAACLAPGFKVETPMGLAVSVDSLKVDDPVQQSLSLIIGKLEEVAFDVGGLKQLGRSPGAGSLRDSTAPGSFHSGAALLDAGVPSWGSIRDRVAHMAQAHAVEVSGAELGPDDLDFVLNAVRKTLIEGRWRGSLEQLVRKQTEFIM